MKNRLIQAYKQAPWRVQIQWIGLFLLALVLIAAITGIYLNVSAQAATAGRMIQFIERDTEVINNEIAELTASLAQAKSAEKMQERAVELGFRLLDPAEAVYLEIPGFDPNADLELAPPRVSTIVESPMIRSAYKSSLWEWFVKQIWQTQGSNFDLSGDDLP